MVGVLKSKGASMNEGADRRIFIPLLRAKMNYANAFSNYNMDVAVSNQLDMDNIISQAIGILRVIRELKAYQDNNFEIIKSDGIVEF